MKKLLEFLISIISRKENTMITKFQFSKMIPSNRNPDEWYQIAVDLFKKYNITTPNRIAGFMSQCAHESRDFTVLEENLNYSAKRLREVFPRYFRSDSAANAVARNPEAIANIVYMDANRTKRGALGNVNPGDGWRFRGGGIKQLTGRNNYTAFGNFINLSPEKAADYVRTKRGAFESACWFWATNNLEKYADADDIVGMSKRINGGTIGLEDRKRRYFTAKSILGVETAETDVHSVLRIGSSGPDVIRLQKSLGITADGDFGPDTESALMMWQRVNGLDPDGIAGPMTFKKLYRL